MSLIPLSLESASDATDTSDALKDQLRKDVASWREGRANAATKESTELSVAVAKPVPAARAKRAKPAAPAVPAEPAKKKPFGMSYDGATSADYISYRVARGAR
jgi:hypothetical protein